jgi:hypothetical protein
MADPNARDEQLHMVRTWNTVFAVKGAAWGIPPERMTRLASDETAARTILDKVKSGDRTPADVVMCNEAFDNMGTEARFIKKLYLLVPPLTLADLPLPDSIHTPVPVPAGQPFLAGTRRRLLWGG